MKTEDIDYKDGSMTLRGVLVYDETAKEKRPGILVVHEAWGLGEHAVDRARKLAALGYVALAVDMFGDRKQVSDLGEAMGIIGDLLGNPDKIRGRVGAALSTLAKRPQVDATRMGAIGFCFGGSTALELARSGADVAGVVCFHGGLETKAPARRGGVKASVLVCVGAEDPMIPASQIAIFQEEMHNAGVDWQLISYGSTVHSFSNPKADGSIAPVILYNELSDRRSWGAMRDFFEEVFAR